MHGTRGAIASEEESNLCAARHLRITSRAHCAGKAAVELIEVRTQHHARVTPA
jgi:hypothetical protein